MLSNVLSFNAVSLLFALCILSLHNGGIPHAEAAAKEPKGAANLWSCPSLVDDGDAITEPTFCTRFHLQGDKGTLINLPFADITLEAAVRVFLGQYFFFVNSPLPTTPDCRTDHHLATYFSTPTAELSSTFVAMVSAGVFRRRWVALDGDVDDVMLEGVELEAYQCILRTSSVASSSSDDNDYTTALASIDGVVTVERGVFTGDLFLGRTPGGEIIEGETDGEEEGEGEGGAVVGNQPLLGSDAGTKSSLSWADGGGMIVFSQDSFVDPFVVPTTTTTSPSSMSKSCWVTPPLCARGALRFACSSNGGAHQQQPNQSSLVLGHLPSSFDTSTSRYVSGKHFDEVHFSTHITVSRNKRMRVTAIVHLDVQNSAPRAIDSEIRVVLDAPLLATMIAVSMPVDFVYFRAYDADFKKLRNDFELHHINILDRKLTAPQTSAAPTKTPSPDGTLVQVSLTEPRGQSEAPFSSVLDCRIVKSTSASSLPTGGLLGDNTRGVKGSIIVVCPHEPSAAILEDGISLNVSWHVQERQCGEGSIDVVHHPLDTTPTAHHQAPPLAHSIVVSKRLNAKFQGNSAPMPRCIDRRQINSGSSSSTSESLVVSVATVSAAGASLNAVLGGGRSVSISFPFVVWDSEGLPSESVGHTTLTIVAPTVSHPPSPTPPVSPLPSYTTLLGTTPTLPLSLQQSSPLRPILLLSSDSGNGKEYMLPMPNHEVTTSSRSVRVSAIQYSSSSPPFVDKAEAAVCGSFMLRATGRPVRVGDIVESSWGGGLDSVVQFVPCSAQHQQPSRIKNNTLPNAVHNQALNALLEASAIKAECRCHSSITIVGGGVSSSSSSVPQSPHTTTTIAAPLLATTTSPIHRRVMDVTISLPIIDSSNPCDALEVPIRVPIRVSSPVDDRTVASPVVQVFSYSSLSNSSYLHHPSFATGDSSSSLNQYNRNTGTTFGCASSGDQVIMLLIQPDSTKGTDSCRAGWTYANLLANTNAVESFSLLLVKGGDGKAGGDVDIEIVHVNVRLERRMEGSSTPTISITEDQDITRVIRLDHGAKDRTPLIADPQELLALGARRPSTPLPSLHLSPPTDRANTNYSTLSKSDTPSPRGGESAFTFGVDAFGSILTPVSYVVVTKPSSTTTTISGTITDTATMSATAPLAAAMEIVAAVSNIVNMEGDVPTHGSTASMCQWLSRHNSRRRLSTSTLPHLECIEETNKVTGLATVILAVYLRNTSVLHCDTIDDSSSSPSSPPVVCRFRIVVAADSVVALFQRSIRVSSPSVPLLVDHIVAVEYASKVKVLRVDFDASFELSSVVPSKARTLRFVVMRSAPAIVDDGDSLLPPPLASMRLMNPSSSASGATPSVTTSPSTETSADILIVVLSQQEDADDADHLQQQHGNATRTITPAIPLTTVTTTEDPSGGEYDPDHPDAYHVMKACLAVSGVFILLLLVKYQEVFKCFEYCRRSVEQSNALRQATREASRRVHKRKRVKGSKAKKRLISDADTSEDGISTRQRATSSFLNFIGIQHSAFSDDDEYEHSDDEEDVVAADVVMPSRDQMIRNPHNIDANTRASDGVEMNSEFGGSVALGALGAQAIGAIPRRRPVAKSTTTSGGHDNATPPPAIAATFSPREEPDEDLGDSFGQYRRASIMIHSSAPKGGTDGNSSSTTFGGNNNTNRPIPRASREDTQYAPPATAPPAAAATTQPPKAIWAEGSSSSTPNSPTSNIMVPPPQRKKKSD